METQPVTTGEVPASQRIRVLVAKPGMDRHDRGAKVIARAYRDAGMEVIYTGLHQSPAQIARAALEEDVDVVALSILSGAHNTVIPRVCQALREVGLDDVVVLVGGVIPPEDVPGLLAAGVTRVFGPGSSTEEIVAYTREQVRKRRGDRA
ncbi:MULTISPECIES: cobalamin B12-binding domain-containing protein [Thermaerobacter]|uniref:Cobalamin B12-binding domain-containing protein n=1 Tax=Thermaerobacter composti TaxID=554949 RepID=A0ABZ0QKK6_9FIRM|nr:MULTISPECIES: cobalamin B12-binding domain-containing protein [Thermaerobacter]PZN07032.1 MAG: methylmalonyl-CoA mutase [Bacillota bacterium]QBS38022.1 cobalamin B12-binding domain-containing protein [Thermaerobacter sp. FW80]WPD18029.1 cobalamin B12-binding domain-containing protein [Thermaerobacter composti]